MGLEIDPDTAEERIDNFIKRIDALLEKRYAEGEEEKKTLSTKLDNFAKLAFSDGGEKRANLHRSVSVGTLGKESSSKKQRKYEQSLKRKKRNLEAWKDQIEIERQSVSKNEHDTRTYDEIEKELSEIRGSLPIYTEDLEQSVEELRNGHYLAAAMVAGRVIDHVIDQVKSSQRLGGPEEVLNHLEEERIIDSEESKITSSIKSYRNKYAHEVGKSPDFSESVIILLGCTKLLKNIQEEGKAREYDLV